MNVFASKKIAETYEGYYKTPDGRLVDNLEKELIKQYINYFTELNMLEIGCGTGQWTEFFAWQSFHVTAVDLSESMLSIAKRKIIKNAEFEVGDALNLSFPDKSFPVIASITMLEFVKDIQKAIDEMYRILQPGGILILGCLNKNSELGKAAPPDEILKQAHFFTKDEIKEYLSIFGEPVINECIHYSPSFEVLDGTPKQDLYEGAFLAVYVQKTKY